MSTVIQEMAPLTGVAAPLGSVVPAGFVRKFIHAIAYNSTAPTQNLDLYLVPALGSVSTGNQICHPEIVSGDSYLCPELVGAVLGPGGQLWGACLDVSFGYVAEDTPQT